MKRFLSILTVLMLCACSAGKLKWSDVEEKYLELQNSAANIAENASSFLSSDYKSLLDQFEENINNLQSGIGKNDTAAADKLYELAVTLDKIASLFSSDSAAQLITMASHAKDLVVAAYNRSDDFDSLKQQLLDEINEIRGWSNEQWSSVEKKKTIDWSSVEEEYAAKAEEIIDNLQSPRKVTELELEELNNVIVDYYERIEDGVNEDNKHIADEIYAAGLELSEYTDGVDGETPEKVHDFGLQAMQYVINCYGGPVTLENYDFLKQVQDAKKWSLSLWNELTAILKKY